MFSFFLVALPPELFANPTSRLEELYLQNNSLSVLAPGLFNPLEHLLVLNLSRNELTNDWVTSSSLKPLVRLVALDLSYNRLTKLDQSMLGGLTALQILNVCNNNLHTVAANTFLFQHNLHILLLSHNDLESLHPRAVSGLPVLNSLSLGMISHKMSPITIFGHKHKIKNFIKNLIFFMKKFQWHLDFGPYLESNFKF